MSDSLFGDFGNGECAVCGRRVPINMLLCGVHWRVLPAGQKAAVNAAWRAWQDGEVTLGELRSVQEEAVAAVAR